MSQTVSSRNWLVSEGVCRLLDSQSAMDMSKNSMYRARTKHINSRYHWIQERVESELLQILKINPFNVDQDSTN